MPLTRSKAADSASRSRSTRSKTRKVEPPATYSYIVPGSEDAEQGHGAIYRAPHSKDKLIDGFPSGEATSYEVFQHGLSQNRQGPCFGTRGETGEFQWETYEQVNERITHFASGLVQLGLIPEVPGSEETGPMRLLALYIKNRAEWVIAEQACFRQAVTTVPMYDTLGPDTVEMIFNETELATVVAAPGTSITALLDAKDKCPSFCNLIYVDELPVDQKEKVKAKGVAVYSFKEVEAKGKANVLPATPPKPDSIATFCYTSGTTGKSKGALLTHRNLVSVTASVKAMGCNLGPDDRHLSYLPLAHVFERATMLLVLCEGARVGFFSGETAKLPEDIKALQPTLFPSVPRLLNRFYDKIFAGVQEQGGMKAKLFHRAYAAKQARLKEGKLTHSVWDKVVFRKVAARIGLGNCKLVITGSAPIAPHVLEFLRILLSCSVVEGYGQTETGAGSTVQHLDDYTTGNVGMPLGCCEIRLESVPDMGYLVTDEVHGGDDGNPGIPCRGRGEICFRGPNNFKGYYKMPDKTAEALDSEGWVHSGDIGIWLPTGQLKIVDRKKNIFKLAQGEYIAPEKIENVYTKCAIVAQAFVYGDSFQHQLVAIIVPDPEAAPRFCRDKGLTEAPLDALCRDEKFKKAVMDELQVARKEAKLFGFEHAADIFLDPSPFTPENDLLTPTFKLKRDVAKKHYQKQIDAMYAGLGGVAGVAGLKQ